MKGTRIITLTETTDADSLPNGWVSATLGDISADLIGGGTPSRGEAKYFGGDIVWLTPTEIPKDRISTVADSREKITDLGLKESSARLIPKGSVLLTSRASIGYVGIAGCEVTTNQGFASFIVNGLMHNLFLAYWLWGNNELLESQAKGTTFKEISKTTLRELTIPVPPLTEQHRIVEKLEKLIDRVRSANATIERVPVLIKQFRQAVLAAACSGKLVEQDPNDEPASVLLERIRTERRKKWETDLIAKGKDPEKHKYQEPAEPDISELPELPNGWVWTTFEQILNELRNGFFSGSPAFDPPGIPILRISAVRPMSVVFDSPRYVRKRSEDLSQYMLRNGDLLFTRYNGTLELVGACGMVRGLEAEIIHPDKLICVRVSREYVLPEYLESYFATSIPRAVIENKSKSSAGQQGISGKDLRSVPVALPPVVEQERIVAKVSELFKGAATIEAAVAKAKANSANVTQSLLAKAFRGELVEQDPKDEPASVLLEKIKSLKAAGKQKSENRRL